MDLALPWETVAVEACVDAVRAWATEDASHKLFVRVAQEMRQPLEHQRPPALVAAHHFVLAKDEAPKPFLAATFALGVRRLGIDPSRPVEPTTPEMTPEQLAQALGADASKAALAWCRVVWLWVAGFDAEQLREARKKALEAAERPARPERSGRRRDRPPPGRPARGGGGDGSRPGGRPKRGRGAPAPTARAADAPAGDAATPSAGVDAGQEAGAGATREARRARPDVRRGRGGGAAPQPGRERPGPGGRPRRGRDESPRIGNLGLALQQALARQAERSGQGDGAGGAEPAPADGASQDATPSGESAAAADDSGAGTSAATPPAPTEDAGEA